MPDIPPKICFFYICYVISTFLYKIGCKSSIYNTLRSGRSHAEEKRARAILAWRADCVWQMQMPRHFCVKGLMCFRMFVFKLRVTWHAKCDMPPRCESSLSLQRNTNCYFIIKTTKSYFHIFCRYY